MDDEKVDDNCAGTEQNKIEYFMNHTKLKGESRARLL